MHLTVTDSLSPFAFFLAQMRAQWNHKNFIHSRKQSTRESVESYFIEMCKCHADGLMLWQRERNRVFFSHFGNIKSTPAAK